MTKSLERLDGFLTSWSGLSLLAVFAGPAICIFVIVLLAGFKDLCFAFFQ